jgi:hexosaminidase
MEKYNIFHWHIVDAETFPIFIKSRSKLIETSLWHNGFFYTENDMIEIINFANERGFIKKKKNLKIKKK